MMPTRRSIEARSGSVSPAKLAHFVLVTRDLPRLRDWYVSVLEGRVIYEDPVLSFITYDEEHHRIAIGALPGVAEREAGLRVGLHHTAFTYRDVGDLLYSYRRLKARGIEPYWCINHGPTTSMYYRDPDTRSASCSSPRISSRATRQGRRWNRCASARSCRRARRRST
jgi:catechol 2,3-dioxygenase-like lactoylglutathione lyase family enzyme